MQFGSDHCTRSSHSPDSPYCDMNQYKYSGGEIFENIDESVLKVALRILQKDKKAEIIGDDGVKFF